MASEALSDMVVDVMRAADPQAFRVSYEKLRQAQKNAPVAELHFDHLVQAEKAKSNPRAFSSLYNHRLAPQFTQTVPIGQTRQQLNDSNPQEKAYKNFEALMLQNFVQHMFTTDSSSVFGKGQSGEIWKSMMAEAMGKEMAEAGGIGIAKMLEKQQSLKDHEAALKQQEQKNIQALDQAIAAHKAHTLPHLAQSLAERSKLTSVQTYLKHTKE